MDYEKLKATRNHGFIKAIGFDLAEVREGYARGELEITPEHANPIGSVHGGVIFSMADSVGGAAASSYNRWVTSVSGNINYLNPAMNCKKLIAESREIKNGKKIYVCEVTITDEAGRVIAVSTMTYFCLEKKGKIDESDGNS